MDMLAFGAVILAVQIAALLWMLRRRRSQPSLDLTACDKRTVSTAMTWTLSAGWLWGFAIGAGLLTVTKGWPRAIQPLRGFGGFLVILLGQICMEFARRPPVRK